MECKYNQDEFCTNDQCPMYADYCPVPDIEGVCKYEDCEEEIYVLAPKGCLEAAMLSEDVILSNDTFENIWSEFCALMEKFGYLREES